MPLGNLRKPETGRIQRRLQIAKLSVAGELLTGEKTIALEAFPTWDCLRCTETAGTIGARQSALRVRHFYSTCSDYADGLQFF